MVTTGSPDEAREAWATLDAASQAALVAAWEAVAAGDLGIGAALVDAAGQLLRVSRNRMMSKTAPPGEVAGSSLAHAEINVLATLPARSPRDLTLVTSLQPCLQCSAAIRMGPIREVHVIGADRLWDGAADFSAMSPWIARRPPTQTTGPRFDQIGTFATTIARLGPSRLPPVDEVLLQLGEAPVMALADALDNSDHLPQLLHTPVSEVIAMFWDRLTDTAAEWEVERAGHPSIRELDPSA